MGVSTCARISPHHPRGGAQPPRGPIAAGKGRGRSPAPPRPSRRPEADHVASLFLVLFLRTFSANRVSAFQRWSIVRASPPLRSRFFAKAPPSLLWRFWWRPYRFCADRVANLSRLYYYKTWNGARCRARLKSGGFCRFWGLRFFWVLDDFSDMDDGYWVFIIRFCFVVNWIVIFQMEKTWCFLNKLLFFSIFHIKNYF